MRLRKNRIGFLKPSTAMSHPYTRGLLSGRILDAINGTPELMMSTLEVSCPRKSVSCRVNVCGTEF